LRQAIAGRQSPKHIAVAANQPFEIGPDTGSAGLSWENVPKEQATRDRE
jgi:hypothetical protein